MQTSPPHPTTIAELQAMLSAFTLTATQANPQQMEIIPSLARAQIRLH